MFEWLFGDKHKKLEQKTLDGFSSVKKDIGAVGKWIKYLDGRDKQVFDILNELKLDLSSVKEEIESLREGINLIDEEEKNKQVFKKMAFLDKQTAVGDVEKGVQTAVQTGNFYEILKGLSANERLLIFTLMNSDMKLSYEDLALLLGKERSTVRGQINNIKQKSEGLVMEITEKNGKKRVFVPLGVKEKLSKYAKVRVEKSKKVRINGKIKGKNDENV
ncbi:MAG: hypothetical protein AABX85_01695 [Nanoarchaeota archaeon]